MSSNSYMPLPSIGFFPEIRGTIHFRMGGVLRSFGSHSFTDNSYVTPLPTSSVYPVESKGHLGTRFGISLSPFSRGEGRIDDNASSCCICHRRCTFRDMAVTKGSSERCVYPLFFYRSLLRETYENLASLFFDAANSNIPLQERVCH